MMLAGCTCKKSIRLSGSTQEKFPRKCSRTLDSCLSDSSWILLSLGISRARNTTAPSTKYRSTPTKMASRVEQRMAAPPAGPGVGRCFRTVSAPALLRPGSQLLQLKHQQPQQQAGFYTDHSKRARHTCQMQGL